jgi:hypothetical protein
MLNPVNARDTLAVGRLLEFVAPSPPWNRSLWSIGLVLGLRELHEACTAIRGGMLSEPSAKQMCTALMRRIGREPALSADEKTFLRLQISSVPRADGPAHFALAQMADLIETDYLNRCAQVTSAANFAVEHFARNVAAHLLDLGFSPKHLHKLIRAHLGSQTPVTLADLCEDLHAEVARSPLRAFEVLIAFSKFPKMNQGVPPEWLKGEAIGNWLASNNFPAGTSLPPVGVLLTVEARDSSAAAQAAREISDRFAARARIATGSQLHRVPWIWVAGDGEPHPLAGESRGVRVKELDRERRIFSTEAATDSVDAAIELMAHLDESSPPAAIAGGWAAIEGLLASSPNDRSSAADNLAVLVACSFPRAELTGLCFRAGKEDPSVLAKLETAPTNRDRSKVMAQLILTGEPMSLRSAPERAAVERVSKLLRDPHGELVTIKDTIAEAFHRLYRQRNLILHGGRLDSVALKPSLRTVSKLAGAGLDRITHGHYVQSVLPLELVARAELAIALINKATALTAVDLLERT